MGKKTKAKVATVSAELPEEVAAKVAAKQKEGNVASGMKKFKDALEAYDVALKALPEKHPLIATLHGNKAAVYMMDKKYKEAVKECNSALAIDGSNTKILGRRGRARVEMGMFKDALSDIQKVNQSPEKTAESNALETRLKEIVSGKTASPAPAASGNTSAGNSSRGAVTPAAAPAPAQPTAAQARERAQYQLMRTPIPCKVTFEGETKWVHVPYGTTYHALQREIRSKWAELLNFKVLFWDATDKEHVTVTCQRDVLRSLQGIMSWMEAAVVRGRTPDVPMPSCRFSVVKCKRSEVPPTPAEEVPKDDAKSKVIVKSTDPLAEETVVELDDWLIDFANLFRDHLGVDPDKHVDVHREGWEKCTAALDAAVKLPEAQGLFDESIDRFRDVTCIGLYNWGNVHVCLAKKIVETAASKGQKAAEIQADFDAQCASAMSRYKQALEFNPQYVDGLLGIASVQLEQAKLASGLLLPPLEAVDDAAGADPETQDEINKKSAQDANAKLKVVLKTADKAAVKAAAPLWQQVYDTFGSASEACAKDKLEVTKEREAGRADDIVSPDMPDQTHLLPNQVQIMWGNALYDQSQLWAGLDLEGWKAMVSEAQGRFTQATCNEKDVLQALRNHLKADELDLPEPVEEAPVVEPKAEVPEPTGEPEAEDKKGAKGLPSLAARKAKNGGK